MNKIRISKNTQESSEINKYIYGERHMVEQGDILKSRGQGSIKNLDNFF